MKKIALVAVAGLALATAACSKPAEEVATEADAMAVAEEPMVVETPVVVETTGVTVVETPVVVETPAAM